MANITYRCPVCGGEIGWNAAKSCFLCEYCDGEFSADEIKGVGTDSLEKEEHIQHAVELDEEELAYTKSDDGTEGTKLVKYRCSNCQAELITEAATAASVCVYCGKPIILTEQIVGDFAPKYIIPFKKTQEEAMTAFSSFMKKPLCPKNFKDSVTVDKVQGIYIPFWLFNGKCNVKATFETKKLIEEKKITKDKDSYYKRKWEVYESFRSAENAFDKIPLDGSEKTDDAAMQSICPYDFNELIDFNPTYLSSYLAERYDEDATEQKDKLEPILKDTTLLNLANSINFDTVKPLHSEYEISYDETEYALLPTWLLYCTYNNKKYLFAMNGQTGKFVGNLPVDKVKAAIIGIGTFILSAIVCWGFLI